MERPTKVQIRELPLYLGLEIKNIAIIENNQDAIKALEELKGETCIGFDTESKPIFHKGKTSPGPTLIQLATESKAFLFPTKIPTALSSAEKILSNPNIKKVGFGIHLDIKELSTKLNINVVNTENLSIKLMNLFEEEKPFGAQTAVAMILKARLSKRAQKSNWGAYPLSKKQILYAANDAHSAICIENKLSMINVESTTL